MVETKHHQFSKYKEREFTAGLEGKIATQLMRLYRAASEFNQPTIVELGTATGASTTMFLQACEETNGRLVSVDIADCSSVANSPRWHFVQSDSKDVPNIITQAPFLRNGVDVLYIDSLHTKAHVEAEVTGWYPYLKQGAHIFFDDVDATPYRRGQRKDNYRAEVAWDEIRRYVENVYLANEDDLYLDIMYGTTGLAHLFKLSPLGTPLRPAVALPRRRKNVWNQFQHDFIKRGQQSLRRRLTGTR